MRADYTTAGEGLSICQAGRKLDPDARGRRTDNKVRADYTTAGEGLSICQAGRKLDPDARGRRTDNKENASIN